jgi:hypothetical protein
MLNPVGKIAGISLMMMKLVIIVVYVINDINVKHIKILRVQKEGIKVLRLPLHISKQMLKAKIYFVKKR